MQFRTSFVGLRSPPDFMKVDAKFVTVDTGLGGGEGKVWSETRLNRRVVITRMRVATFSGASTSARLTGESLGARVLEGICARTILWGYEGVDVRRGVE